MNFSPVIIGIALAVASITKGTAWDDFVTAIEATPQPALVTVTTDITVAVTDKVVKAGTRLEFSPGKRITGSSGKTLIINGSVPDRSEQFFVATAYRQLRRDAPPSRMVGRTARRRQ
jgi:hypothetical protein